MAVLVNRSVVRTLSSMALPLLAGTFAMNAYNLADTWFVSRLGTLSLAAMGFTFPVVMLLTCIARGIGAGVTTLVSHAIGRHDQQRAAKLVGHGMILTLGVTVVMSTAGYLLIDPIFQGLGADASTLPLIGEYMRTWFLGAISMTLPMVGGGILISCGDSKSASGLMIVGTVLNMILDPIMIFGLLGWPAMGIRGAALATVISQAVSTLWLIQRLHGKHRLLPWRTMLPWQCIQSIREITGFAVPSILSMILMPVSATVITRLLSDFGPEAVAASGAAGRIEIFAFVIPMALGISLTPFVSQNLGARRLDRIGEARKLSMLFALIYGAGAAAVFFAGAPWLAGIFTENPRVAAVFVSYVRIVSFGYGMMEIHRYCGFFLTGLHKPLSATALNAVRVLVLLIPLSYLGRYLWGVEGIFWGRLAADWAAALIGLVWLSRAMRHFKSAPQIGPAPSEIPQPACVDI